MSDINLTQTEADSLFKMEKVALNSNPWSFPTMGEKIEIPLDSLDRKERFLLDISRGTIDLNKIKYQNRARQVIILVRLELSGAPHRNPDGVEVPTPHIHKYKDGFADKWAFPIPDDYFHDITDNWETLQDFMSYCNITRKPNILKVLF